MSEYLSNTKDDKSPGENLYVNLYLWKSNQKKKKKDKRFKIAFLA